MPRFVNTVKALSGKIKLFFLRKDLKNADTGVILIDRQFQVVV